MTEETPAKKTLRIFKVTLEGGQDVRVCAHDYGITEGVAGFFVEDTSSCFPNLQLVASFPVERLVSIVDTAVIAPDNIKSVSILAPDMSNVFDQFTELGEV